MTTVQTPSGAMRGETRRGYSFFRGVRYAQAPVGERRFAPPEPVSSWEGEYDATQFGASAPQDAEPWGLPQEPTDEDCLFLNIYTPASDDERRPVLFWIHGGAYVVGSGRMFHGGALAREHDVVVVSINYRLGALGFMHVGHLDASLGQSVNNGVLDQIAALRWVRDHIAAFGGDPGNVMIFGESAGATTAAMLMGCPDSDGLFHKAAIHSPNVDLIDVGEGHVAFTNRCIEQLGGDPEAGGLQTLRGASVDALVGLNASPGPGRVSEPTLAVRRPEMVGFSPAIDGLLIPRPIAETVRQRGADNVPFLGGGCRHEGTLFPYIVGDGEHSAEEAAAMFQREGVDGARAMEVYERFAPGSTPRQKLVYALTDTMFRNSMVRILDAAAESGGDCWSWMCTWESSGPEGALRATHSMDLFFFWGWTELGPTLAGDDAPGDLGAAMRAYWANFARTGRPTAEGEPEWPTHRTSDRPVLLLEAERRIEHALDDEVRALWLGE